MIRSWTGSWIVAFCIITTAWASPTNRGYSGAPGSLGRCSSSCHGAGTGTVEISGFPTEYVPDATYLITIEAVSGFPIKNFNASVRAGTGANRAGTISVGQNTATYNVAQETNGVRLATLDHQSATFNWQAPAAGTGTVRMYVAAHQGARNTGPNTNLTIVSTEAVVPQPPDQVQCVAPSNGAGNQPLSVTMEWLAADGATSYEVYFGITEPLTSLSNTVALSFPLDSLLPGTTYLWRIDAINDVGTTQGVPWYFTTEEQSPAVDAPLASEFSLSAAYPNPFNGFVRAQLSVPMNSAVTARIYDRTGREVATLLDNVTLSGLQELEWNASSQAAGLYFLRCDCNGLSQTQKLVYLP